MIFEAFLKLKVVEKLKRKLLRSVTLKLCIHSSVATIEARESESAVEAKCYQYKKNTIEVLLE